MNTKVANWQQQLARIKLIMQEARESMRHPRPRRGRKQRGKVAPKPTHADAPDLRDQQRDYEEAERQARRGEAEIVRNPYGNTIYPI